MYHVVIKRNHKYDLEILTENDKGEAEGEMGGVGIFLASYRNRKQKYIVFKLQ